MGVNVTIYARGEFAPEELEAANKHVSDRCVWWFDAGEFPTRLIQSSPTEVEFQTFSRYYGPGYERGDWPELYGAVMAMCWALPRCTVFYGSDSDYRDDEEVTTEWAKGMWEHWLSEDGLAYYRH